MPFFWGLSCGIAFGIADLLTGLGIRSGSPYTGAIITSSAIGITFSLLLLFRGSGSYEIGPSAFWFVLAGFAATGPGRALYYVSIQRIGVSRASTLIIFAPLFSLLFAVLFLGERPTWHLIAASFCVVGGITVLMVNRTSLHLTVTKTLLGLIPAMFFGLAPIFIRVGMQSLPDRLLGNLFSACSALLFLFVFQKVVYKHRQLHADRRALQLFVGAGICYSLAFFLFFAALSLEMVAFVVPLVYTSPLFSILLARIFLQRLEQVTWHLLLGASIIFLGVIFVSLSRS